MNVLFDLDGTLTDPRSGIIGCIRHALTAMDRRCPPDGELVAHIGPPIQQTFATLLGGDIADVATAVDLYSMRPTAASSTARALGNASLSRTCLKRYCKAFVRSPVFLRTPGSGSRPKRRVMSFRIDVVS